MRRFTFPSALVLVLALASPPASGLAEPDSKEWTYLENESFRLGVHRTSGATIGYLSRRESTENILNHYDQGRFIQQSYYGDADGSRWKGKPWRLNPVQGGSWQGSRPKLLELTSGKTRLYSRSLPLHWATGRLLPEFELEQWIELHKTHIHLRFRMTYRGERTHAARHQELPAVFVNPAFGTLVFYEGQEPWTGKPLTRVSPGPGNAYADLSEHWAAYLNKDGFGLGVFVPIARRMTYYHFRGAMNSSCSYLAPIKTFALKPSLQVDYDAYLCLGSASEIRSRFTALQSGRPNAIR